MFAHPQPPELLMLVRLARRHFAPSTAALALLVALSAGCGGDGGTGPAAITSVSVTPGSLDVIVGQSQQLNASAYDANGAVVQGRGVKWHTDDASVATVTDAGVVTAVGEGTTTVTAVVGTTAGSAIVHGKYRFPNFAGTYDLVGDFDDVPGTFTAVLTLTQASRNDPALGGTLRMTSFLGSASSTTFPVTSGSVDPSDSIFVFSAGPITSAAGWAFAGGFLSPGRLYGVHELRSGTDDFTGTWTATRR